MPEEAEIVKGIFTDYLSGLGYNAIAKKLNKNSIRTRNGKAWGQSSVQKMLHNVTYTGTLLLQKTYSENHLTKRKMKNEGQLPMYRVKDSHEAIIPQSVFDAVQAESARRSQRHYKSEQAPASYPFTRMLKCACCGKHYRRKVTATGPVWICGTYNSLGKAYCQSKQIPETTLIETTCSVLCVTECTEEVFQRELESILVQNGNRLVFRLKNGTEKTATWQDRSRSQSWTPEMRKRAGEKTRKRYEEWQDQ